jgi:hypothetical protein
MEDYPEVSEEATERAAPELTPERTLQVLRSQITEGDLERISRRLIDFAAKDSKSLGMDGMKSIQELLRWLVPKEPATIQSGEGSVQKVEFYLADNPDDLDDQDMVLLDDD